MILLQISIPESVSMNTASYKRAFEKIQNDIKLIGDKVSSKKKGSTKSQKKNLFVKYILKANRSRM